MPHRALALPLLAFLVGCTVDENPIYRSGVGDYRRGLALEAPFAFGRTEALAGNPLLAARMARDIENFTDLLESDPLWSNPRDATLQPQMQIARRDLRAALGIPPTVPGNVAAARFETARQALAANDLAAARAALTPLGGPGTLDRLSDLPRLPTVEQAANALANEAGQERNPDRGGRGRR